MCGIVGGLYFEKTIDKNLCINMNNSIKHRGPDDEGFLFINTATKNYNQMSGQDTINCLKNKYKSIEKISYVDYNLFLAQRRLSIIDLSELGHQPMCNEDSTIWLVFNGEIYNYAEIRNELLAVGHIFKSNTDSEVIIHAYEEWGEKCLDKFNGMWAFALYDLNNNIMFLSRDRFGVKPLYYYNDKEKIIFASEIKAILSDKSYKREQNDKVINKFLQSGIFDDSHETFFEKIYQLEPSHYMIIKDNEMSVHRYFNIEDNVELTDFEEAKDKFFSYFYDSVKLRLRADVPIGTLLSGGLDSSSIVSMIRYHFSKENCINEINTFSSIFSNKKFDEQKYIDEVNSEKKCKGHKIETNPLNLEADIENLIYTQEEPFGSLSIYAQWNVMNLVSKTDVKVLLDGQGADEILAGYEPYYFPYFRYLFKKRKFKKLKREVHIYLTTYNKSKSKVEVFSRIIYNCLTNLFKNANRKLLRKGQIDRKKKFEDPLKDELYNALNCSLRQLLHYEDRNSMAFSIESRVPFLDYKLVQYLFLIPNEFKINNGITKHIMRESLNDLLPKKIKDRKDKMGFVTPQEVWQRNELKDYFTRVLNSDRFKSRKYYKKLDLDKDDYLKVWRYINVELWMRMFID